MGGEGGRGGREGERKVGERGDKDDLSQKETARDIPLTQSKSITMAIVCVPKGTG